MVMDRASWLWRRKPSDKSPVGSDSSVSLSLHSEQCSDDQMLRLYFVLLMLNQEILRPISDNSSPCHGQIHGISVRSNDSQKAGVTKSLNGKLETGANLNDSTPQHSQSVEPHISSNVTDENVEETVKSLNDKLSAALLTIKAKEDLVKQHAKVTEEAVAGWEQAEAEVIALKGLLEAASLKNAALEDRVSQLDKALKECVRQLRLAREEQEEKIHDIVAKKSQELESENSELRKRLEVTRLEASSMLLKHDLQEKLQIIEKENMDLKAKLQEIDKENMDLKAKLLVQSKDMKILLLERDLSNQAAETASKQHLESVKKIARVEAECRSHSDNGEGMAVADNELRNSDSWTSALCAEVDQFKNGKDSSKTLVNNPVEIDIMDDFLEMEKLAALPYSDHTSSSSETDSEKAVTRDNSSKVQTEELKNQVTDLQEKFEAIATEKRELEMTVMEMRNQLDISSDALVAAKHRLVDMQMQLDLANKSKLAALEDVERLDSERKALELQLESKSVEAEELLMVITSLEENSGQKELESQLELISAQATELRLTVASLEDRVESERALSVQQKEDSEAAWAAKEEIEAQLCSAITETAKLHDIIKALENDIEKEKALHEDLTAQLQLKIEAAVDAVKESMEAQICSANTEVEKLRDVIKVLEDKVAKEKALHEELAAEVQLKIEAMRSLEFVKESLEAELCSANSEIQELREITKELENKVEKEKVLKEISTQFEMKIEAEKTRSMEAVKESLEAQLCSANAEIHNCGRSPKH
ncbi:hypothetical protein PR202_gb00418 [Eleusine coracana subsp. coracana]|uniref:Filament-like plant protein n=1 Tax=Eleusine coracana subsp. coracana TaxID=191504 RepID=A0AAV5DTD1_ELECO|nr:hypothetical protein PR202_gb00418 [Eleusine coracana subsp. coracana]